MKPKMFESRGCSVNTETHYSVSVHPMSRHNYLHTTLDCTILPNVLGLTPTIKLETPNWRRPRGITLADEQFDQPIALILSSGLVCVIEA
jgi:hypothetical protein